jgi:hypothetical protein
MSSEAPPQTDETCRDIERALRLGKAVAARSPSHEPLTALARLDPPPGFRVDESGQSPRARGDRSMIEFGVRAVASSPVTKHLEKGRELLKEANGLKSAQAVTADHRPRSRRLDGRRGTARLSTVRKTAVVFLI